LVDLENVIRTEDEALVRHEQTKQQTEAEISDAEATIEELKEDLATANEDLENRTTQVEQAKKAFNKTTKAADQVLKDIAAKVCEAVEMFRRDAHCSPFRTVKSRSSGWSVRQSTGVAGWKISKSLY
jgi:predicted  nucleic acid-binding Zn-ribbon protein